MGLNTIKKIKILICFITIFIPQLTAAELIGPIKVIEGNWGTAENEFTLDTSDYFDAVSNLKSISISGSIFIVDSKGVLIYKNDRTLYSIIKPKNVEVKYNYWPAFMDCDSKDNIYTSNWDNKLQKYNRKGELLWEKDIYVGEIIVQPDDSVIIMGYRLTKKDKEKYVHFSSTGDILKTYPHKPLILGEVHERSIDNSQYKVTIKYPDKTYEISKTLYKRYSRICNNMLYAITSGKLIDIFDDQGNFIERFEIPENNLKLVRPVMPGISSEYEVIEGYGEPVIAPTGDIYTWKRTPETYSIIKWVWVDGPDAPHNLNAESIESTISLSWEVPAEDADKVKEYEIVRSSDVCSSFDVIGKVEKDTVTYVDKEVKRGETYYYKVRAVKEDGYSGYSNKAVGNL